MSGIAGIYNLDQQPVRPDTLRDVVDVLAHRGVDGRGIWREENIGLGHQMLAVTPESAYETFPLVYRPDDGDSPNYVLTADARIDNREELIRRLSLRPEAGRPVTDADIILAAYHTWGRECASRLIGAFAFVIWDPSRRSLYCARDHYGLKPFYYAWLKDRLFVFGTEQKAVLQHGAVPRSLNDVAVLDHLLVPVQNDVTFTFYNDIHRLAPGHYLVVDERGAQQEVYWALDPAKTEPLTTDEAYAEGLRDRFTEAVRCRLRSAHPVGSMLSGGLDSSSIVCVAARELASQHKPLHTFSAVFDTNTRSDERPYIDAVLDAHPASLIPHITNADDVSPFRDYDRMLWHQDCALQAGNMYFFWDLFGTARSEGVRVVMDGFDGDTTLSHGTGYLHELARQGRWFALYREVKQSQMRWGLPWKKLMWKWVKVYGVAPLLAQSATLQHIQQTRNRWAGRSGSGDPRAAGALHWTRVLNTKLQALAADETRPRQPFPATEREQHYRLLQRPLMQRIIETWEAAAAAFGLELRLPFCDRRLMEYCLAMPPEQKIKDGWTRLAMRRAMEGILPPLIQWRATKGNLAPGFEHGLLVRAPEFLQKMIREDLGGISRFVDMDCLARTMPSFDDGVKNNHTQYHWRALSLALWLNYSGM